MARISLIAKTIRQIKHSKYFRLAHSKKVPFEGFEYYDDFENIEEARIYLENLSKTYYKNETERKENFQGNSLKIGDCIAKII